MSDLLYRLEHRINDSHMETEDLIDEAIEEIKKLRYVLKVYGIVEIEKGYFCAMPIVRDNQS